MSNGLTDQPGRVIAVFVISPVLFYKGYIYNDYFILLFSIILFCWDLYWLVCKSPMES